MLRRVWTLKGQRPRALSSHNYEWLYVFGFVHPCTGRTEWMIMPEVSTGVMSIALGEFARAVGAGSRKNILLVLDQAGWHISNDLVVPAGIHLVFLPSYTPELQPAERLWPLINEAIANQDCSDLDTLERRLVERCRELISQPKVIQGVTQYHWWPNC